MSVDATNEDKTAAASPSESLSAEVYTSMGYEAL